VVFVHESGNRYIPLDQVHTVPAGCVVAVGSAEGGQSDLESMPSVLRLRGPKPAYVAHASPFASCPDVAPLHTAGAEGQVQTGTFLDWVIEYADTPSVWVCASDGWCVNRPPSPRIPSIPSRSTRRLSVLLMDIAGTSS
jgi:hypothetical protein